MLNYQKYDNLDIISYSDLDFPGCNYIKHSICGYIYMLVGGTVSCVWSSGLGIIKKGGGVELIINELLLIKNLNDWFWNYHIS